MARPVRSINVSDIDGPMATAVRHARQGQVVPIIASGKVVARIVPVAGPTLTSEEEEVLWAPHLDQVNAEARACIADQEDS